MKNEQNEQKTQPPRWPTRLLCAVVAIEAVAMLVVTGMLVVDIFTMQSQSVASAIALTALAVIATVLLIALTFGLYLEQRWVRGLTAVWQVLQVAAAVPIIQGDMADTIGWGLATLSLVGLLLVFHPAVVARLNAENSTHHAD